ncbi:MAG: hypothetical protein QY314_01905 [Candidatus Dojkabacteria bacterium]|nr:MAG: hypothetical protein QY314_01905 [Candidatus Dojkabacteria bacterium]
MAVVSSSTRDLSDILKTSQQKAFSTGALTVALIAILVWGSLRPTIITIFETGEKFNQKTQLLEALKSQNSTLTQLLAEREEAKDELQNIDLYFPYDGNFSLFIINLNQVAHQYDFRMPNVSFAETSSRQIENNPTFQFIGMRPTTFQIGLEGNPANIFQFSSYVENTPFFPKLINISYSNPKDGNTTAVDLTYLVYKLDTPLYK